MAHNDATTAPSSSSGPWTLVEIPPDLEYKSWVLLQQPTVNEDNPDIDHALSHSYSAISNPTGYTEHDSHINDSNFDQSSLTDAPQGPYDHAKAIPSNFLELLRERAGINDEAQHVSHAAQDLQYEASQKEPNLNGEYCGPLGTVQLGLPECTIAPSLGYFDPDVEAMEQSLTAQLFGDEIMDTLFPSFFSENGGDPSKSFIDEGMAISDVATMSATNFNGIQHLPFNNESSLYASTPDQTITSPSLPRKQHPVLLQTAFTAQSSHPDEYLRGCLDRVLQFRIHCSDKLEPTQQSPEGKEILGAVPLLEPVRGSIYRLFVDPMGKACLICGKPKTSLERSVGCVRKHLNHRPFVCTGQCSRCGNKNERARFFTRAKLEEHMKGPTRRLPCPKEGCGTQVLFGNLKRHLNKKHPHETFPDDYTRRG